jgi:TonB-dependent receptor
MSDEPLSRFRACCPRWLAATTLLVLAFPRLALAQDDADAAVDDAAEAPAEASPAKAPAEPAEPADDDAALAEADAAAMEEDEGAAEAELRRAASKGKGVIWGIVRDTKFNEGVIDAQVQIVGRKEKTFANVDGGYRLELPPGKYSIRVSFELHQPTRVDTVEVKAGQVTRIDFKLVPDESSVEEVVIEDEADHSSTEGQNLGRKRSAVVGDGVGRAEIARTPDKNAAEAAQRVVGATIVNNRFVYVRGLGERYTNALLNGVPLPSTEPDRNTVPLDLFPSLVLESLTIVKQFTPDMPGDFAGGSVRIATREFPKQPLFQLSLNGAFNTATTFRTRPTYRGSWWDWAGFDGGRRSLPNGIPNRRLRKDPVSAEDQQDQLVYGHRVNSPMSTHTETTPPNYGASLVAGDALKLKNDMKLGGMLALTYGHSYQLRDITVRRFRDEPLTDDSSAPMVIEEFAGQQGIESVRWGAFGSLALQPSRDSTVRLIAFRSQSADDLTSELEGNLDSTPGEFHVTRLEYVSRSLNFVQLAGEHRFPKQNELEIAWHASIATAERDQPDTRDHRYRTATREGVPGWEFSSDQSGQHSFLEQSDTTLTGGVDVTQPLIKSEDHRTSVKVGTLISSRRRDFRARRFRLVPDDDGQNLLYQSLRFCPGKEWNRACPNLLFREELIGPGALELDEWTLDKDEYESGLDIYAAYAMVDAKVLPQLRMVGGVRPEITYQALSAFDPFDRAGTEDRSNLYQTDWLPALSVIYSVTPKVNARLGGSQTVARPQLRELSPALATSYSGEATVQGDPRLRLTKITNADLRLEYFPTLKEVLALSVFYKHFERPIEEILGVSGFLGFVNAPGADLYGVELEGRKTLDALLDQLKDFTLIANVTLVKSQVDLGADAAANTNASRPLSGQSPYVINLALDYDNESSGSSVRALYNVFGPRISVVGSQRLPDIYELPRHQLDLTASQKLAKKLELKLQAQNILNAPVIFGFRNEPSYRRTQTDSGSQLFRSLGRSAATRRYDPGVTFALTASYTY